MDCGLAQLIFSHDVRQFCPWGAFGWRRFSSLGFGWCFLLWLRLVPANSQESFALFLEFSYGVWDSRVFFGLGLLWVCSGSCSAALLEFGNGLRLQGRLCFFVAVALIFYRLWLFAQKRWTVTMIMHEMQSSLGWVLVLVQPWKSCQVHA
jgi:hypothetical protein